MPDNLIRVQLTAGQIYFLYGLISLCLRSSDVNEFLEQNYLFLFRDGDIFADIEIELNSLKNELSLLL